MAARFVLAAALTALVSHAAFAQDAAIYSDMDRMHPVWAPHGIVASQEALATRVGVDILARGGNAVDAAVAVGFALAVTLPQAGNLGGGGFMLVHDAKTGETVAIDYREKAPGHRRPRHVPRRTPARRTPTSRAGAAWRSASPAPWPA